MSYTTGGIIQATDYNTFSTLANAVNEVFADDHSGATTIAGGANYGYGQSPALTAVSTGDTVTAAQWGALFSAMRASATHQGTSIVPPVPASNPAAGSNIEALNTPTTMSAAVTSLRTNRMNLAGGQTTLIVGTGFSNPAAWTTSLTYTFQVDFGSWNNARYYFNTGGSISITGVYTPAPTPDETAWATLFSSNFPVNMNWNTTTPTTGGNLIANPAGFYLSSPFPGLTTSYQTVYQKYLSGSYTTSYATIEAKLTNTAGTNGKIDFRVTLVDDDTFPVLKGANRMTFTINRIQAAGTTPYSGTYAYTSNGFVSV
jgi:hypothetical protein